ncbi:hypothetical protein B484DRAFT_445036 [Ochromonadaceae sp. CCMP2298]|nr:hypothetical protein B484DRAFT_445036 [Ochromonadaceae sp. CCMP2298]
MKLSDDVEVLRRAAETKAVERQELVAAVRGVEQDKGSNAANPEALRGQWEVTWSSSPGGAAQGWVIGGFFNGYFAIKEVVDFYAYSVVVESLLCGFEGDSAVTSTSPCVVIEADYKKFKFGFIKQEVPPNTRVFTFSFVGEDVALARLVTGAALLFRRLR